MDDARVATLIRPVDRTLVVLKFTLVPFLAIVLSFAAVRPVFDAFGDSPGSLVFGLLGSALAALYVVLAQRQTVGHRVDRFLAQLSRWVALTCNHDYASQPEKTGIACKLTPEAMKTPLFAYQKQKELVKTLSQACDEGKSGRYWFVEGSGGSGKTRAALMLVQALVRDDRLCELGNRCYLYDFSESKAVQRRLIQRLGKPSHIDAVVLVDNFQLVESDVLHELTERLVVTSAPNQARLVIFLARLRHSWNLGPGADVRLLSEAKAAKRHFELPGPRAAVVKDRIAKIDDDASRQISALRKRGKASAAQLHLAQVIVRSGSVPQEVELILTLLNDKSATDTDAPELVTLLGILAALSVHRGSFSDEELRRAIHTVAHEHGSDAEARLDESFGRLHGIGLIAKDHRDGARFVFHEDIAALCVDRLSGVSGFRDAFLSAGQRRLEEERSGTDRVVAWLLAAELGDQDAMLETFEAALSLGASLRMKYCLERASSRGGLVPSARLQMAILLDRVGDFAESQLIFADELVEELGSASELTVLLAVSRIEANHFRDYEADLAVLRNHPDPLVKLIGGYWEAHIRTHEGIFDPEELFELESEALALIGQDSAFWQVHSLARMHFDSLRSFYLSGKSDIWSIDSPQGRDLDRYLEKKLPVFKAMQILYKEAHLVGHVLLPRLALLGERVDSDDAAFAGLELSGEPTVNDLTRAMLTLYRRAQGEFWQYGDREATYLQADILNAEMVQPDADLNGETITNALKAYEHFIVSSKFNSLNSYPHFYCLRWNVLMRHEALARGNIEKADDHFAEAERHLERIAQLDDAAGNVYGQLRARLLKVLLLGLEKGYIKQDLVDLHRQMCKRGYGFEQDLILRLIESEGTKSAELVQIFRFYPFVHQ